MPRRRFKDFQLHRKGDQWPLPHYQAVGVAFRSLDDVVGFDDKLRADRIAALTSEEASRESLRCDNLARFAEGYLYWAAETAQVGSVWDLAQDDVLLMPDPNLQRRELSWWRVSEVGQQSRSLKFLFQNYDPLNVPLDSLERLVEMEAVSKLTGFKTLE